MVDLYQAYKKHAKDCLPLPDDFSLAQLSKDKFELVEEVYRVFGQYTAWKLSSNGKCYNQIREQLCMLKETITLKLPKELAQDLSVASEVFIVDVLERGLRDFM